MELTNGNALEAVEGEAALGARSLYPLGSNLGVLEAGRPRLDEGQCAGDMCFNSIWWVLE